jgi:hypothetical protein
MLLLPVRVRGGVLVGEVLVVLVVVVVLVLLLLLALALLLLDLLEVPLALVLDELAAPALAEEFLAAGLLGVGDAERLSLELAWRLVLLLLLLLLLLL